MRGDLHNDDTVNYVISQLPEDWDSKVILDKIVYNIYDDKIVKALWKKYGYRLQDYKEEILNSIIGDNEYRETIEKILNE